MLNFSVMFEGAIKLFHSPNIGELMGHEEPFDLREAIASVGITPDELAHFKGEEVMSLLRENDIDPSELSGEPIPTRNQTSAPE